MSQRTDIAEAAKALEKKLEREILLKPYLRGVSAKRNADDIGLYITIDISTDKVGILQEFIFFIPPEYDGHRTRLRFIEPPEFE